jgi:ornithine carbamoyltransferase
MKHLLTIAELSAAEIAGLLRLARELKTTRGQLAERPLAGQTWALIFTKASTRTRVSFEVAIRELGGHSLYLSGHDIQMGRGESVPDTARVLSRYVHGVVIRTFAQRDVEEFAQYGSVPVINALTDAEHPCQILADLLTIEEKLGTVRGKKIVFIGDGACNVPASWIAAAPKLGFDLWIAAPKEFQPAPVPGIQITGDGTAAAKDADVLYTDVWVSMGKETEAAERLQVLAGYQINDRTLAVAKPGALVMHCLPAYREKEITGAVFEAHQQTIFDQAENRLHVQKAILVKLAEAWRA